MQTLIAIALAAATLVSLVLHYLGKKSAKAEKAAEELDKVEAEVKSLDGK